MRYLLHTIMKPFKSIFYLLIEFGHFFLDNGVTWEAFQCLTDDTIKELIPKVGPRIIFFKRYSLYKTPVIDINDCSFNSLQDTESGVSSVSRVTLLSPTDSELLDESCKQNNISVYTIRNVLIILNFKIL